MSSATVAAGRPVKFAAGRQLIAALAWVSKQPWLLLPLLALPALLPFWLQGLPRSDDILGHLTRLIVLDNQVRHGTLFSRWAPELMAGYGYPVFGFYGPAAYYLAELFRLAGAGYDGAVAVAFVALVLLAGGGACLFARDLFGKDRPLPALVAAVAYMYSPYLLTNVFVRGAIAEVGAQALLPWILWGLRGLMRDPAPGRYVLPVALGLGGLAVTHDITLLLAPPLLAGYVLLLWWREGFRRRRLGWAAFALLSAMGISAWFWLPLIAERGYLTDAGYSLAAALLPRHAWTWSSFLDTGFAFNYAGAPPFRLGLVQLLLAGAGLVLARRRDAEWLFLLAAALVLGSLAGRWALPLWLGSPLLLTAQFPWRLLTLISLPLALFAGAILLPWRPRPARIILACGVLALLVAAERPRLAGANVLAGDDFTAGPAAVPRLETSAAALGRSYVPEFTPRWVQDRFTLPAANLRRASAGLELHRVGSFDVEATVSAVEGGPLRFTTFYFPGWRVVLDRNTVLRPYPSTDMGLLTVDLPPGAHELKVTWAGTFLERGAGAASLLALAALAWFCARRPAQRWLAAAPAILLAFGLLATFLPGRAEPVRQPQQALKGAGLELLGYRVEEGGPGHLRLYPYWYVTETPAAALRIRWQAYDAGGRLVGESAGGSYFGSTTPASWAAGTLVDDGYDLALLPGLPAGSYRLEAQLLVEGDAAPSWSATAGGLTLDHPVPAQPRPAYPLDIRLGIGIRLAGYDVSVNGKEPTAAGPYRPPVRPGDTLDYTLYWQALAPAGEDYHAFLHLVDAGGSSLAQLDHVPGDPSNPPTMWNTFYLQRDRYSLRIPADAAGGVYYPWVGLYDFKSLDRLPVRGASGEDLGDAFSLPPVKVVGSAPAAPQHRVTARFGDVASLEGYDLDLPKDGLKPGSQFTVTLHFRGERQSTRELTRFVHLYDATLGMAAQGDGPPQSGRNPVSAWAPGETIADRVTLTVAADAAPGSYALSVGLYNPADGTRVPVKDAQERPVPDGEAGLASLLVGG